MSYYLDVSNKRVALMVMGVMKTYATKISGSLFKVRGIVNSKGWLEWKVVGLGSECSGLSGPGSFVDWKDRALLFETKKDNSKCAANNDQTIV